MRAPLVARAGAPPAQRSVNEQAARRRSGYQEAAGGGRPAIDDADSDALSRVRVSARAPGRGPESMDDACELCSRRPPRVAAECRIWVAQIQTRARSIRAQRL